MLMVAAGTIKIMDEREAEVRAELQGIIAVLQELTGLPSRWSGRVGGWCGSKPKGKKRFTCNMQINAALAEPDARWPTPIRRGAAFSFSAGLRSGRTTSAFRGWEEGVVEQLQRFFRSRVLSRLGATIGPETFRRIDAEHSYNGFIEALETLRLALGVLRKWSSFTENCLAYPSRTDPDRF